MVTRGQTSVSAILRVQDDPLGAGKALRRIGRYLSRLIVARINAPDKAGPILKMTLPDLLQLWLVEPSNTFQSPQWLCWRHYPRTASSGR